MATVELRFSAQPAHVRTARLVAASVARRSGLDETALDEVRLAVGEACSRAVALHRRAGITEPIRVVLQDDPDRFCVQVCDAAPDADLPDADAALVPQAGSLSDAPLLSHEGLDEALGLAVLGGLVEDLEVSSDGQGVVVRMTWPAMGR